MNGLQIIWTIIKLLALLILTLVRFVLWLLVIGMTIGLIVIML